MNATIKALLDDAGAQLSRTSASPRLDAEVLLAHVLDVARSHLVAHPDKPVDAAAADRYRNLIGQRAQHRPVAQLTGRREFWSLDLNVTADTLVPRPETEVLVEKALTDIPVERESSLLDLGTGTGAIALAVAAERPHCRIAATDNSAAALAVARRNVERHAPGRIELVLSDWYAGIGETRFDVIISNPPYIVASPPPGLVDPELAFEPAAALYSGVDGLDAIRRIVAGAAAHLNPGGVLWLEHGHYQQADVAELLTSAGFDASSHTDYNDRPMFSRGLLG